jgi:hypothetical protein
MKKLLVILTSLLLLNSSSVFADWEYIGKTKKHNWYIDYQSIQENNGYYNFYILTDLFEPDKDGDLSYAGYRKVDCRESRYMILSEFYYSKKMGKGKLTTNPIKNPEWQYPPPGSVNQTVLRALCDFVN